MEADRVDAPATSSARTSAQWIGAVVSHDLLLLREMLNERRDLANSLHKAFDDPFRDQAYPVATLLYAVAGPPHQTVSWDAIERPVDIAMVELLIDFGADPNVVCIHGVPISFVRSREIAAYLVRHGADVNYWHHNGGYPVSYSIWRIHPEQTWFLLDLGADPNLEYPDTGETVLHTAVLIGAEGHPNRIGECMAALIDGGIDLDHQTLDGARTGVGQCPVLRGDTALHLAAAGSSVGIVAQRVEAGADRAIRNAEGLTAVEVALRNERSAEVVRLLQ